ncbi:ATP-binding protein [Gymnodinialimonas ceratoperidinii]|uniref:ATP-binding protein n=1 Tax=Gymnodinialimonas ceratoperidinii TaxID=2856823 RepID=A0A8F6TXV1_9RHOB|nr:ATP-binding protein [Gymnodinialimonas ceratoperidinii]QXT40174.1 ATP-binding protein [Gymnodinialimonas ceratoperidinii]
MSQDKAPDVALRFLSGSIPVRHALEKTRAAVRAAKIDGATCDTSQIILGEVLNNVVEHAYGFEPGHPIAVSIWLREDGLWCEVMDHGARMPDSMMRLGAGKVHFDPTNREALPEGGFGWAMVCELTEKLRYRRVDSTNQLAFLIPYP